MNLQAIAPSHHECIRAAVQLVRSDLDVGCWAVMGSVARGTASDASDVDLLALTITEHGSGFKWLLINRRLIEFHIAKPDCLAQKVQERPSLAYGLLEATWIDGDTSLLKTVQTAARRVLEQFSPSIGLQEGLAHWLRSASAKVRAARADGDAAKAGFVLATSTWTAIELLWLINGRPVPCAGQVFDLLGSLSQTPPNCGEVVRSLCSGTDEKRVAAFLHLADWLLTRPAG